MRRVRPISHEDRLSVVDHLDELRNRLIVCVLAFVVAWGLTAWQNHRVLDIMNKPLPGKLEPITLGPAEAFYTTLTNSAFAETWDGVLDDSAAYAAKSATVTLNNAALAVATTKTFSTPTILEKDRSTDVTVTLHADSSTATASPKTLTIADTTAGF